MEERTEEKSQESLVQQENQDKIKIVGFLCNWCSYAGADLAGTSRFQYSTKIRVIRVMCSGRIDPFLILQAFKNHADGVLIGGCHLGDCHYIDGNHHAFQKIKSLGKILQKIGIDDRRLRLEWISAAEGRRFAEVVNEFTDSIKSMGKLSLDEEKAELLDILIDIFADFRFRWLVGKKYQITQKENVYGSRIDEKLYEELLEKTVDSEILRHQILKTIEHEPRSTPEISEKLKVPTEIIMTNLITMLNDRKVAIQMKNHDAYFIKEVA